MEKARKAALEVLLHNIHGPYDDLPRTAGWGYPEPYTRDWMIAALGILVTKNEELIDGLRRMLIALGESQTRLGNIASLAHVRDDYGASDTTPLFLIALALFRSATGEPDFLEQAANKALSWIQYQSPDDVVLTAQQPTSDWRDEQWVWGYGLYVNTLVYACLRLYGLNDRADALRALANRTGLRQVQDGGRLHEGLGLAEKPYYALWVYKVHISDRFDLLGNSLAILFGLADKARADQIILWLERSCIEMRAGGILACDVPPCLIPFILQGDEDWLPRYALFNKPGQYHNGGIWPFTVGAYVAALVAAGHTGLAGEKLSALSRLVVPSTREGLAYGFNEWLHAQDCSPGGQDWQTWSAAMFLYAAECVDAKKVPFFETLAAI